MSSNLKSKLLYKAFQLIEKRTYGKNPLENVNIRQEEFLFTELAHQASTYYGRLNGFDSIKTIDQFQTTVPLTQFSDYEPYFHQLKRGTLKLLFNDRLVAWLLTSGTTSAPKMVPFTDYMAHRLGIAPISLYLSYIAENPRENLRCLSGNFLSIVADPEVERINNLPVGYVSGVALALKAKSKFAASMFTPSLDVLLEKDWDRKYWKISQQATQQNVSMIAGLPVYIVDYLTKLDLEHKYQLGLGNKSIMDIWPDLKLVIWSGAKLEGYRPRLGKLLDPQVGYRESYGATEPGLIAYQADNSPGMIPVVGNNFFEFIPLTEWRTMEAEGGDYQNFEFTCQTLQDISTGKEYVIVMTTVGGMYRYIIGDIVVFHRTDIPRFNWSGRITWYSNIALERMNYGHIEQAIHMLSEQIGVSIPNFSYTTSFTPPRYVIVIESDYKDSQGNLGLLLDECLMEVNAEYQFCRTRNLLHHPKVNLVPLGTYGLLERIKIQERANRIGQFKPPRFVNEQTLNLIASLVSI